MPKEIVLGQTLSNVDGSEASQFLAQISWSREAEYVQLATFTRDPQTFESNSRNAAFVDLDRRGINELIRRLRQARDQAFGRDE